MMQGGRFLRPGYLTVLMSVLVLFLAGFAYFEIETSQETLLESMHRGSISLVEAVARGGENALRSDAEIENLSAQRLLSVARLIRDVELGVVLTDTLLVRLAEENNLFRINVFDQTGLRTVSNVSGAGHNMYAMQREIDDILDGTRTEKVIGFKTARFESGNRFAAVVRRWSGGAIVVNIDADQMLEFRRAAGVGRLIQEIGENLGVIYVVLQDHTGIVLGSRKIARLPRIAGDVFLERVLAGTEAHSRETVFEGEPIYETAMPFAVDENTMGLLRIGLSADVLQAQNRRMNLRLSVLAVLVGLLLATGFGLRRVLKERAMLAASLKRQDRLVAMGELASGVAHEVRNPLNAIGMIVQRLEREFEPVSDREGYQKLTQTVRQEVKRVNGIVQQFLTFARPPKLVRNTMALVPLLQKAIDVVASQVQAKGLRLVTSLEDVGMLQLDADQFLQVIQNLLQNAIDATEAGEIFVGCKIADAQWVAVTVKDTGSGIAPENLERIFDLYFTTKLDGTGLGLSLVHRIITEHGGHIQAESQVGMGTVFQMMLPREV